MSTVTLWTLIRRLDEHEPGLRTLIEAILTRATSSPTARLIENRITEMAIEFHVPRREMQENFYVYFSGDSLLGDHHFATFGDY